MFREVARCPYCQRGVVALDDDVPALLFEPDRPGGGPCPHLALVSVALEVYRPRTARPVRGRGGSWLWVRGEGLSGPDARRQGPGGYLTDLARRSLPYPGLLPGVAYRLAGCTSWERDEAREGSGYFAARGPGGRPLAAGLNGWAAYAPDPAALVADVRRRLDLWDRLSAG